MRKTRSGHLPACLAETRPGVWTCRVGRVTRLPPAKRGRGHNRRLDPSHEDSTSGVRPLWPCREPNPSLRPSWPPRLHGDPMNLLWVYHASWVRPDTSDATRVLGRPTDTSPSRHPSGRLVYTGLGHPLRSDDREPDRQSTTISEILPLLLGTPLPVNPGMRWCRQDVCFRGLEVSSTSWQRRIRGPSRRWSSV